MLYIKARKEALQERENKVKRYNEVYEMAVKKGKYLYDLRKETIDFVKEAEELINSIANTPKEIITNLNNIKLEYKKFSDTEELAKEAYDTAVKAGVSVAGGVAGGAAIAGLAPSMAMWVATTFGTASTGTAISSLSGAVATKAALAWLGGGALSAGGAGIAGGQALLALAGPIGWGLAGLSAGLSVYFTARKNKKVAEEAMEEVGKIAEAIGMMNSANCKIDEIIKKTRGIFLPLKEAFDMCAEYRNAKYEELAENDKDQLAALVNNTLSLSEMLNKTI